MIRLILKDYQETSYDLDYKSVTEFLALAKHSAGGYYIPADRVAGEGRVKVKGAYISQDYIGLILELEE